MEKKLVKKKGKDKLVHIEVTQDKPMERSLIGKRVKQENTEKKVSIDKLDKLAKPMKKTRQTKTAKPEKNVRRDIDTTHRYRR